jgi:hypothetical protein
VGYVVSYNTLATITRATGGRMSACENIKLLAKQIDSTKWEVTFDIQPLADKIGISKQRCAELLADEVMKIFGVV